jgi:Ca2+-transporting ATPase
MQSNDIHSHYSSDAGTGNVKPGLDPCVIPLHTTVPGRARFRVIGLFRDPELKARLEQNLVAAPGITSVMANILTGNLLVLFDDNITIDAITDHILANLNFQTQLGGVRQSQGIPAGIAKQNVTSIFSYRSAHLARQQSTNHGPSQSQVTLQQNWHTLSKNSILKSLGASIASGLAMASVPDQRARYGANAFPEAAQRSKLSILGEQFISLPVGLLGVSSIISIATGGLLDAAVIMGVVMINATIGYFTESNAEKTISALSKVAPHKAIVLRDGEPHEIPVQEVVVGDLIILSPGMFVPADARLWRNTELSIDESALTGESLPVMKSESYRCKADTPLADRLNMVYMGTMVTGGSGVAVVVATGLNTELGKIQAIMDKAQAPRTPMQRQLDTTGTQLAILSGAVCAGVFGVGLFRGYRMLDMLKSSISLAVAAVPEGLPAVATTALAMGIQTMRKHQVAIRQLAAVETLGAVQVICLDKTGTLTINKMSVVALHVGMEQIAISDQQFVIAGQVADPKHNNELIRLLEVISLCSEVKFKQEQDKLVLTGSPTENALVQLALSAGIEVTQLRNQYLRTRIQYRSDEHPYMTTTHAMPDGQTFLAVKGSPADVLSLCRKRSIHGELQDLDDTMRQSILHENETMAGNALRVLGVAYQQIDVSVEPDTENLIWLGLVGMADPLRTGMPDLMNVFHRAGIHTVMITGDQTATAYAIGKQLNLSNGKPLEILDSGSLDKLDPVVLSGLVKKVHVFSRVSPAHKLKIVQAMQQGGNVVAMTGDGINDGPALKVADIGVAMGNGGTDVARSVAGVVLEDDHLPTMVEAVRHGRTIYMNIRKAIHFLLATNFTEIEVMLVGIALGRGEPLNPMQLLWINLISDIFPGLALSLEPAEPDVLDRPPRESGDQIIRKADLAKMGLESFIIASGSLAGYGYGLLRYGSGMKANTMAFTTLTFGQLLHAISCRSDTSSIFSKVKRPPNNYLKLALGGTLGLQVLAMFVPGLRRFLGTAPLGLIDTLVVTAGASLPLLINEANKEWLNRDKHKVKQGSKVIGETGASATSVKTFAKGEA